ncbi:DUF2268 domain-containing putative Zn-dependent protease [Pseudomonas sp. JBR1]|uniref:DUF2268 domain-containing putative Zn-dependent protease n=1 Tax=Pseudomonas sp. JBR1 TaxID=3020907 RepID=UPI0023052719|nr:DUF2268 domain-containing putative Zn-dependent protease [Pseudomonas sp. JBR1]WCE07248.1 DUF2268 domain-containing putative Zn-dependent protease [Pseudomonas sp. JBR1]
MSCVLHLLNASGRLDPWRAILEETFTDALPRIAAHLPEQRVDVVVQAGAWVIPELGLNGYSPDAERVFLTLDPDSPHLQQAFPDHFTALLGHELHHCLRHAGPGYGSTLGEALVSEGLACQFERELTGRLPFYAQAAPQDMAAHWEALGAELDQPYDHARWFFGSGDLPRHLGYALGSWRVGRYLQRHGLTAATSGQRPADTFLAG